MGVALVVSPRQAGELYHVAATQTGIAEPDALIGIHSQARVVVVVQRAAERDLPAAPHSRPGQPLGQLLDRDGLFGGVNRPRVGDAPIPGGATRLGLLYTTHIDLQGRGLDSGRDSWSGSSLFFV